MSQPQCLSPSRIPASPPPIAPVPSTTNRPLWSVMIPTYNCLSFLQGTLESVLAQDPGPEHMQIAVIDDCSTDGDVAALVRTVGKNRVEYFQQPSNQGSLRNFETCLNRSLGHWVHILHGDDRVVSGFYEEIGQLFTHYPEAGAAFTNTADILGEEEKLIVKAPHAPKAGLLPNFLLDIAQQQMLVTPSIVVKRSVYEKLGGFYGFLYGEDWEMWARISAHFPIAYSPKCLAHYRFSSFGSLTHYNLRSGRNLLDVIKLIEVIQGYLPTRHRKTLKKAALRNYALYCGSIAHSLYPIDPAFGFSSSQGRLGDEPGYQGYLFGVETVSPGYAALQADRKVKVAALAFNVHGAGTGSLSKFEFISAPARFNPIRSSDIGGSTILASL
jgi:glycosyltransferase involved in cell wall biosynthesis